MPNNLQHVATGASKDKQVAGVWIAAKRFLDLESKPVHAPPHIGLTDRQPDSGARWYRDHRPTTALMIAAASSGDTETGMRT